MGKITYFIVITGMATLILSLISCKNTSLMIVAEEPTKVFKSYPDSGPPKQDEVITVLNKGETGAVIHTQYSKDFMFYKIRLQDGRVGYVWVGDKFTVVHKTSKMP